MTTAMELMVTTWRFRYAFAPSCTAPEICRIRSLPAGERTTMAIKMNAAASPIRAHTIDRGTPALRIVRPSEMLIMLRLKVRDFSGFSSTGNSLFAIADKHLESDSAYRRASAPLARGRWCPKAAPTIRIIEADLVGPILPMFEQASSDGIFPDVERSLAGGAPPLQCV